MPDNSEKTKDDYVQIFFKNNKFLSFINNYLLRLQHKIISSNHYQKNFNSISSGSHRAYRHCGTCHFALVSLN